VDESAKAVVSLNLVGRVIVLKKRPLESARSGAVLSPPKRHKGVPPSSSGVLAHRAHRSDVESADRASKRVETCSFRCFRASGEASSNEARSMKAASRSTAVAPERSAITYARSASPATPASEAQWAQWSSAPR
jgi:hypothetical protein